MVLVVVQDGCGGARPVTQVTSSVVGEDREHFTLPLAVGGVLPASDSFVGAAATAVARILERTESFVRSLGRLFFSDGRRT